MRVATLIVMGMSIWKESEQLYLTHLGYRKKHSERERKMTLDVDVSHRNARVIT